MGTEVERREGRGRRAEMGDGDGSAGRRRGPARQAFQRGGRRATRPGGLPEGQSLTPPRKLQPRAAFPDAAAGGSNLAPVRFQLLDLGLGDGVLGAPVEAAHGATVLVEGELQRRVALLRVQERLAPQDHSAEGRAASLHPAHHPQHRRLEQLCGEEAQWLRMHFRPAQGSQGTRSRWSTVPRPLSRFPTRARSRPGRRLCVHVEGGKSFEMWGTSPRGRGELERRRDQV